MNLYETSDSRAKAIRLSAELLRDAGIALFPLDIERMLKRSFSHQIYLIPYSSMNKGRSQETGSQVSDPRQLSADGFCMRVKDALLDFGSQNFIGNIWRIFYNDSSLPERIRFTLLHELGHVFIGHHQLLDIESTAEIEGTQKYRELDGQADRFAINSLAPAPAAAKLLREHGFTYNEESREWLLTDGNAIFLRNLGQEPDPIQILETSFDISRTAATRRLVELQDDLKIWEMLDPNLYAYIEQIGYRSGWYCWVCHTRRRTSSPYCSGCGNGWSYEYKDFGRPARPVINLKDNGQFAFCSVCGNTEYSEDAKYCPICGAPLINECLNAWYSDGDFIRSGRYVVRGTHYCKPTDIYCGLCGVLTSFGKQHGARENLWLPSKESTRCRMKGTSYPPVFKTDGPMLNICPSCGSERTIRNGRYCANCKQPMSNYCIGEKGSTHQAMPNDRYCSICGQPTIFYKAGYLEQYTQTDAYHHLLAAEAKNQPQGLPQILILANGSWQPLNREET